MSTSTPEQSAPGQAKVKLYWLDRSRSQRILWLLEELHLPYELEIFHRDKVTRFAPPELKAIHPLGKSPVISITALGSSTPIVIAESAFIVEYLLDHFANGSTLLPKRWREGEEGKVGGETEEWTRFRYFMNYAEGNLMQFMIAGMIGLQIKDAPVPFFIRPITKAISKNIFSSFITPNLMSHFAFLEQQLETAPNGGGYLCGPNLTGADIMLSFPLIAGGEKMGMGKFTKLCAYVDRLQNEPGYKKAVEKIVELDGKFEATF